MIKLYMKVMIDRTQNFKHPLDNLVAKNQIRAPDFHNFFNSNRKTFAGLLSEAFTLIFQYIWHNKSFLVFPITTEGGQRR